MRPLRPGQGTSEEYPGHVGPRLAVRFSPGLRGLSFPWVRLFSGSAALAFLVLGAASQRPAGPQFVDVTAKAGIAFKHGSGSPEKDYIFEAKGGGMGVLDYDNDGLLDLYFINGSTVEDLARGVIHPNALYHANGDGTYTDMTARAGVQGRGWGMGCAVGDYNNDGYPDIYVLGLTENVLYRNNGDGTFTDVTERAGLRDGHWSTSAAFLDYDRDGDLDVYVSHYSIPDTKLLPKRGENRYCHYRGVPVMCGPRGLPGVADSFYRNNGDGTFTDISEDAGLAMDAKYYGLGVAVGDYDNDGWTDLYVANDSCPSFLYHNEGNGKFKEVGFLAGAVLSDDGTEQAGMGVDFGDYDSDGWLDITKSNFSYDYNNLYHNEQNGTFTERSMTAGIAQITMPFVCWASKFMDYDNDGWRDIFVATGHVYPHLLANPVGGEKYYQRNLLFRNLGNGKFSEVGRESGPGLQVEKACRGAAFGDLDNDGDIDVITANLDDVPTVLRNDGGNTKNWLILRLNGVKSNRFGLGVRVKVTAGGLVQIGEASTASSIFVANDPRVHFGIGEAREADIEVNWPGDKVQTFRAVPANRILTIDQNQGLVSGDRYWEGPVIDD
ncbi:MAG: CRTAC1 family protein [Acidobacteria bacterium]|nr:CRTAC1 family protein [Acidobacteriota bacterium]